MFYVCVCSTYVVYMVMKVHARVPILVRRERVVLLTPCQYYFVSICSKCVYEVYARSCYLILIFCVFFFFSFRLSRNAANFDVYNIETALPKIDLEAIENHLKAAKEEERRVSFFFTNLYFFRCLYKYAILRIIYT